ncbi:MAG: YraN family protein [Bacteroidales bacterium]|nr:YraN family protein [Bacteroidales bacterium]
MNDKSAVGKAGEDIALEYLQKLGLRLRDRNWRVGHLEIDIVMEDAECVRFVEVKTLSDDVGFDPFEEITELKMKRLIRSAKAYANIKNITCEMVFDVVGIVLGKQGAEVVYLPDAFRVIN